MIIQLSDLTRIRNEHPKQKIVLGSGTFDLLHVGHAVYIKQLTQHGDIIVVLIHGDARVKRAKGEHRPVIPEFDRAELVDALKGVDYTLIVEGDGKRGQVDPMYVDIFARLKPDIFVTTNNEWATYPEVTGNTKLTIFERIADTSTTGIIERIISGRHSQSQPPD